MDEDGVVIYIVRHDDLEEEWKTLRHEVRHAARIVSGLAYCEHHEEEALTRMEDWILEPALVRLEEWRRS